MSKLVSIIRTISEFHRLGLAEMGVVEGGIYCDLAQEYSLLRRHELPSRAHFFDKIELKYTFEIGLNKFNIICI